MTRPNMPLMLIIQRKTVSGIQAYSIRSIPMDTPKVKKNFPQAGLTSTGGEIL
jgi:hypothetical protein